MPGRRRAASVPGAAELVGWYATWLTETGRCATSYVDAAWAFLARYPSPQSFAAEPLSVRQATGGSTAPFLVYLMLHGRLQPGYDYLAARKIQQLAVLAEKSPLGSDVDCFDKAADVLGFSKHLRHRMIGRVLVRLLVETASPMESLSADDLAELESAFAERGACHSKSGTWANDRSVLYSTRTVLYHLGVLAEPPSTKLLPVPARYAGRFDGVTEALRTSFLAYLARLTATHAPTTVSRIATDLAHFGRFVSGLDEAPGSLAELDRRRHIEAYLAYTARARRHRDGRPISVEDRRNRIITLSRFLADITEWGWDEAPARRLVFPRDVPRRPQSLPRYLGPEADRRLRESLEASDRRLVASALLLLRATGLRIGELLDLELDCVHEIPGNGAWLKVPLGKLDTERMVPLDDETVALIDRIVATRTEGRPLLHPRTRRLVQFLFTHHGRRLGQAALRLELDRAAKEAGLGHVTSHQLRHTFATALVNSGVSLQALMALLGHSSAAMSLRYGRLFDATVRAQYERALTQARSRVSLGPLFTDSSPPTVDWRAAPAIKARLAGGFCVRAEVQGPCPYANICEHCPNFRTDVGYLQVLAAQRADTEMLAHDAEQRGWGEEAARHHRLLARLDALMDQTEAR